MRRRKKWSWSVGEKGGKVHVYLHTSGVMYGRIGNMRQSLKHRDKDRAKSWARDEEQKLRDGLATAADPTPTVARVFAIYTKTQTAGKPRSCRYQDARAVRMFATVLGGTKDLSKLTLGEWQEFIALRGSGAITSDGEPVLVESERRPVRPRAVENDCEWLYTVCRWATAWKDKVTDKRLLRENPIPQRIASVHEPWWDAVPHEKNPRRPVATDDRFDTIQAVAAQVHPFLPMILTLAHGTARRIRAILALQRSNLLLAKGKNWPHGRIHWPGETDKEGKEWIAPISAEVRAALDAFLAERPSVGAVYLFSESGVRPVSYEKASKWLRKAERLAKQPKQRGSLWHAYRRGWATARKHLPVQDVAYVGGWKNEGTLQGIYQQPDPENTYRAVAEPMRLKEAEA